MNEKKYKVCSLEANLLNNEGVTGYRFINKTRERVFNKYLATIISTITHYFRTPLIEIKGLAALISSLGNLSDKQEEYLKDISRNIDAVEKNVNNLLSINRINKNNFIQIDEVAIDDCIDYAVFTLAPLAEQKQVVIHFDHGKQGEKIVVKYSNKTGKKESLPVDMVILSPAIEPPDESSKLAETLGISLDKYGFFKEDEQDFSSVVTSKPGIFIVGCAQGPKNIQDSVAQAKAAVGKILSMNI